MRCGRDLDRLRVEPREVEQLLDERRHAHRLLLERDAELLLLGRRRAGRPGGCSVCTKPWIVVTGVRSSCAASATKLAITSFARSSASRDSCSCSNRRTRSSATPVSAATVCSTRNSSSPKNGAYGDVQTRSVRAGRVDRQHLGLSGARAARRSRPARGVSSSRPRAASSSPCASSTAAAPAPTSAATGPSTRSATSLRVVASVIRPRIASCSRCCSGARQSPRTTAGGAIPSRKQIPLMRAEEPPTTTARRASRVLFWKAEPTIATVSDADREREQAHPRRSRRPAGHGPRARAGW